MTEQPNDAREAYEEWYRGELKAEPLPVEQNTMTWRLWQAALSHQSSELREARERIAKLEKALAAFMEMDSEVSVYNSCDVDEDTECPACFAKGRINRGRGNEGYKIQHKPDCPFVLGAIAAADRIANSGGV